MEVQFGGVLAHLLGVELSVFPVFTGKIWIWILAALDVVCVVYVVFILCGLSGNGSDLPPCCCFVEALRTGLRFSVVARDSLFGSSLGHRSEVFLWETRVRFGLPSTFVARLNRLGGPILGPFVGGINVIKMWSSSLPVLCYGSQLLPKSSLISVDFNCSSVFRRRSKGLLGRLDDRSSKSSGSPLPVVARGSSCSD
ncbi:hypothetical protein Bca4012_082318 [Brassica carinata]